MNLGCGFCLAVAVLLGACPSDGSPAEGDKGLKGSVDDETWEKAFEVTADGVIHVQAKTTESCCLSDDLLGSSPAKFFLGADEGHPFGMIVYLGEEDHVVVAQQDGPGTKPITSWTSPAPAARADGVVTMDVPVNQVPGGKLRLWAGRGAPLTVGGQELLEKKSNGAILYVLVDTGVPEDVPPPPPMGAGPEGQQPAGGPGGQAPMGSGPGGEPAAGQLPMGSGPGGPPAGGAPPTDGPPPTE